MPIDDRILRCSCRRCGKPFIEDFRQIAQADLDAMMKAFGFESWEAMALWKKRNGLCNRCCKRMANYSGAEMEKELALHDYSARGTLQLVGDRIRCGWCDGTDNIAGYKTGDLFKATNLTARCAVWKWRFQVLIFIPAWKIVQELHTQPNPEGRGSVPVTCRVKKKIDETHRLLKCCECGAEHVVEVKVDHNGGWKSPRGSRECTNPQCPSSQLKAAAKAAALQAEAIANSPEDYDQPVAF